MSGGVWMSSVLSNYDLGMKQGTRTKFRDHEWTPADLTISAPPASTLASLRRSHDGHPLDRSEFPDAIAVWDPTRFARTKEVFYGGPFLAVRGTLADALQNFNFGKGGLVRFPVFGADLATPYLHDAFFVNFGSRKNTVVIEQCSDAKKFVFNKTEGIQLWHLNKADVDGIVVVAGGASSGADIWVEEAIYNKVFMSEAVAQAIMGVGLGEEFKLKRCVVHGGRA